MKTLVVVSDIHVGHRLAVCPPSYTMEDGATHLASRVQSALFDAWKEVATDWNRPDILVINGEPIDGQGPKNKGVEQWTTNYRDQIGASAELIKMFHAKKKFVIQGSGYHVAQGGLTVEEEFAKEIHAQRTNGTRTAHELFLSVDGLVFNFAHHIGSSISGWNYRSTAIAKEMMLGQLNQSHKYPFDIMVRSHVHYFWAVQSSGKLGVITPSWQFQTEFMQKQGTMGSIPDIGAIRFLIDADKQYTLQKKIFKIEESKPPRVSL